MRSNKAQTLTTLRGSFPDTRTGACVSRECASSAQLNAISDEAKVRALIKPELLTSSWQLDRPHDCPSWSCLFLVLSPVLTKR